MGSPTFNIRLDEGEQQTVPPNPVIPHAPALPGFTVQFNQQNIEQMQTPFPYVVALENIEQSGASDGQVPAWSDILGKWVASTKVGPDGSKWYNGASTPDPSLGVDGDYYLDTTTYDIYEKVSGAWDVIGNIQGATGNGIASITLISTVGLNKTYRIAYTNGGYFDFVVTNGANGTDGATWYSGAGAPSSGLGVDRDYYLNTSNYDIYNKVTGVWTLIGNIKGAKGDTGNGIYRIDLISTVGLVKTYRITYTDASYYDFQVTDGAAGAAATVSVGTTTTGAVGSSASVTNSGSSSAAVFNFTIPRGAVWYNGSGAPSAGLGGNGDYYLDNSNGDVYVKSAGS